MPRIAGPPQRPRVLPAVGAHIKDDVDAVQLHHVEDLLDDQVVGQPCVLLMAMAPDQDGSATSVVPGLISRMPTLAAD